MISFGASESKDDHSLGIFRFSHHSPPPKEFNRETYSFVDPDSRARQILNSIDKRSPESTDLKNRVSFGKTSEDNDFRVSSKPILSYSEDMHNSNKFGISKNFGNMKSQKYLNNMKNSHNKDL